MYKAIRYFPGLNALRFFAAFLVVMHHSETLKKKNGLPHLKDYALFNHGNHAVMFFFVLSGFLITYLLLRERYATGAVDVPGFYLKRIRRIWPLYYLLVVIGTIVLPLCLKLFHLSYEMPYTLQQTWYYFVFFVPGLVLYFYGHHFLEFLWSIGVEEVFYLVWPLFFRFLRKRILLVLLSVFVVKTMLMVGACCFLSPQRLAYYIIFTFNFEGMALGGLGAWWIFNRSRPLADLVIYRLPVQVLLYGMLALLLVGGSNLPFRPWALLMDTPVLSSLVLDLLYLYLIIGVAMIDHSLVRLRGGRLSYLGEISYGIYMYHMLVVLSVVQFGKRWLVRLPPVAGHLLYYGVVFGTVVGIAALSRRYFEQYFLPPGRRGEDARSTSFSEEPAGRVAGPA